MTARHVKHLARECGFELAGIAAAAPSPDFELYQNWVEQGNAGEMTYLTDHRGTLRADPRLLLPSARSIVCVGKLYNGPQPYSTHFRSHELGWISRYAWGDDYHDILRRGLQNLAARLPAGVESRVCVDTAPILERSYARQAGLGWIGKNTCLINEPLGSWFFLGELLTSLELESDAPPPDRCGTCTRCIDACPTGAIDPAGYSLDARLCISYFTIELRSPVPRDYRAAIGQHVFGCDICQDVCPWNTRAPISHEPGFAPRHFAPPLAVLAALEEPEFRAMFRPTPVSRAKYAGFLRNVAIAIGNSRNPTLHKPLERLRESQHEMVREAAEWAFEWLTAHSAGPHPR
jgi:epoxyqueuosine reductase